MNFSSVAIIAIASTVAVNGQFAAVQDAFKSFWTAMPSMNGIRGQVESLGFPAAGELAGRLPRFDSKLIESFESAISAVDGKNGSPKEAASEFIQKVTGKVEPKALKEFLNGPSLKKHIEAVEGKIGDYKKGVLSSVKDKLSALNAPTNGDFKPFGQLNRKFEKIVNEGFKTELDPAAVAEKFLKEINVSPSTLKEFVERQSKGINKSLQTFRSKARSAAVGETKFLEQVPVPVLDSSFIKSFKNGLKNNLVPEAAAAQWINSNTENNRSPRELSEYLEGQGVGILVDPLKTMYILETREAARRLLAQMI